MCVAVKNCDHEEVTFTDKATEIQEDDTGQKHMARLSLCNDCNETVLVWYELTETNMESAPKYIMSETDKREVYNG